MVALPRMIAKRWPGAGVDVLANNMGLELHIWLKTLRCYS